MTDELGALIRESLPTFQAPSDVRAWAQQRALEASVSPEMLPATITPRSRTISRMMRRGMYAAGLVAAAAIGFSAQRFVRDSETASGSRDALVSQLVDTHVRSLMVDHLTDVRSTDQHTVKPWFVGKADVAPRVVDLASSGFPLIGGRLDYVQGHSSPTLVYGRRKHVVNLFMWPNAAAESDVRATYHGFALIHWTAAGMNYWAVTDAAPAELDAFRQAYVSAP